MPLIPKKSATKVALKKSIKKKKCSTCKTEYPLDEKYYPKDKSKSNGFKSDCKWCHRLKNKSYYNNIVKKKNSDKRQTTKLEWGELL
jgi:hypothetical protein